MDRKRRIHISGIGGTAMVAGARLALEAGWEVRGSDNPLYPPTSAMVEALGVPVYEGYAPENLAWEPDVVVIGNALSRGNPEVEAALERRIPYQSLPEWLRLNVLQPRRPVVICGTHGKTTTTALTAHVLRECNLEPGYFIGGQALGFEHSAALGPEGCPFVIEGDEYDTAFFDKRAKFFHYLPEIAVVTSIEFDHGDIYPDLDAIDRAFHLMLRQIPRNGWLVACADNRARMLAEQAFSQVVTYGIHEPADWFGKILRTNPDGTQDIDVYWRGDEWGTITIPLSGRHNAQNALSTVAVATILGASPETIQAGLGSFHGVRRRLEVFLETNGVTYVDDFAHHPTAITETIAGARARWPEARLRVLFEPRSNTTVTNHFQPELTQSFHGADELILGPLFRADRIPANVQLDRAAVCEALRQRNIDARFDDNVDAIVAHLAESARPKDVVLILSNGAFGGIYAKLRTACGANET